MYNSGQSLEYLNIVYLLTLKMGSQPLNVDETEQQKTEVGASTTSLKEECATVTDKSSSKTSIRSKASKTSLKSKMGSAVSVKSKTDDSPKVYVKQWSKIRIPH